MKHPKQRLMPIAAAMAVAVAALTACQDRKPTETQAPPASSGEYPTPSNTAPSSTVDSVNVPGKGTDVTEKSTTGGMAGGASGTVASGGTPGSGSTSGAGTGAAASSDSKVDGKK